jgi:hypothetical protein
VIWSALVEAAQLGLLVVMTGMAAISGAVLVNSIEDEDAGSAWAWAGAFVVTSLLTDWLFWWLV